MRLHKFYNKIGWKEEDNISKDAKLFEDLRDCAKKYVSNCRKRVSNYIPNKGNNILDFASGPIQYKEYLAYSKNFKYRHCVDFSNDAIKKAKKILGKNGKYYCNDFLKIKFKDNFFDCIICIHTLYHIKRNYQAKVVHKLLKVSKKKSPIIIVYSNPNTLINKIKKTFFTKNKKRKLIYFYCHPYSWWNQFNKKANIKIVPWRSFASQHQRYLFPNNYLGKIFFNVTFYLEKKFPNFFVKYFQYSIIILTKK